MSKYDNFRKELRSVIEHYPKKTCPACLDNQYNTSILVHSGNKPFEKIDIPVCNSCKNKAEQESEYNGRTFSIYDRLSEYLGFMTHFSARASYTTKLDNNSMTGDLKIYIIIYLFQMILIKIKIKIKIKHLDNIF